MHKCRLYEKDKREPHLHHGAIVCTKLAPASPLELQYDADRQDTKSKELHGGVNAFIEVLYSTKLDVI